MKRSTIAVVAGLILGASHTTMAQTPFPDIAPCHWAAEAVGEIAGTPDVEANQARNSVYLAQNSVQQVFEGLRCGTPEWSQTFLDGEPEMWPGDLGPVEFSLKVSNVQLAEDLGTAQVNVSLTSGGQSVDRSGQVDLVFDQGHWRVSYDSIAQLDLPLFP